MSIVLKKLSLAVFLVIVLVMSMAAVSFALPATDGSDVKLKLDGNMVPTDVAPAIVKDRTLVPARAVFEAAGGKVIWDTSAPSDIGVEYRGKSVKLKIGSNIATVDGIEKTMEVPAQLFPGDRTLIPVRFVAEALGFGVDWDNEARTVVMVSPGGEVTAPENPVTPPVTPPPATPPAVTAPVLGDVQKVSLAWTGTVHRVTIALSQPVEDHTEVEVGNPNRFYVDLPGFVLKATPAESVIQDANSAVKKVRSSQFEEDTVRVVMDLREKSTPAVSFSADKKSIYIDFQRVKFEPRADGKLSVMLDPGHGASTGGKRSFDGTLREYEFTRDVAQRVGKILQANGIQVSYTVTSDQDTSLNDRCVISNNSDADIFVSIHANAFGTDWNKVNGWEAYVYRKGDYAEELAREIEKASIPSLGLVNRGVKDSDFYVVKYTDQPAVLIEHGFYTNKTEVELLKSDAFRQKCAEADANGIINFFNKYS